MSTMKRIEPSNETYAAAELTRAHLKLSPFRAANIATELCRLGRLYKRISERLCNYPDPTGRIALKRERVFSDMQAQLQGLPNSVLEIDGGGLGVNLVTTCRGQGPMTTWLSYASDTRG